jgi:hypothetical protein
MCTRRMPFGKATLRAVRVTSWISSATSPAAGWRVSHPTCRHRNRASVGTSRAGGPSRRSSATRPAQDAKTVRMADRISAAAGLIKSVVTLFLGAFRITRTTFGLAPLLQSEVNPIDYLPDGPDTPYIRIPHCQLCLALPLDMMWLHIAPVLPPFPPLERSRTPLRCWMGRGSRPCAVPSEPEARRSLQICSETYIGIIAHTTCYWLAADLASA